MSTASQRPGSRGPGSRDEVQWETEHFRVTKWIIEPGGAIPLHEHAHDYVVIPLVTGTMHVIAADGTETVAALTEGQSYTREAGGKHRVENRGAGDDIVFVEVERLS